MALCPTAKSVALIQTTLVLVSPPERRWLQATKSIISGTNTQALTAKADLLKEEVDEAMNKVEQCKVAGLYLTETLNASLSFTWKALQDIDLYSYLHKGSNEAIAYVLYW